MDKYAILVAERDEASARLARMEKMNLMLIGQRDAAELLVVDAEHLRRQNADLVKDVEVWTEEAERLRNDLIVCRSAAKAGKDDVIALAPKPTMPRYDPMHPCPKCGYNMAGSHYCEEQYAPMAARTCADTPHIHRYCRRCEWEWLEAPLDAEPQPLDKTVVAW